MSAVAPSCSKGLARRPHLNPPLSPSANARRNLFRCFETREVKLGSRLANKGGAHGPGTRVPARGDSDGASSAFRCRLALFSFSASSLYAGYDIFLIGRVPIDGKALLGLGAADGSGLSWPASASFVRRIMVPAQTNLERIRTAAEWTQSQVSRRRNAPL